MPTNAREVAEKIKAALVPVALESDLPENELDELCLNIMTGIIAESLAGVTATGEIGTYINHMAPTINSMWDEYSGTDNSGMNSMQEPQFQSACRDLIAALIDFIDEFPSPAPHGETR